jgi:apolipoprotein N-acyltransferase
MHDQNTTDKTLGWAGCVLVVLGALATSLKIDPLNIWLLNIGNLAYLVWAIRLREANLIIVNAVLTIIYVIGLLYRL